jgi:hypothetical protein
MKKRGLLFIVLGFFLMAGIGHAATVVTQTAYPIAEPGGTFTVFIDGVGFAPPTMGGDTVLEFDSSVFSTSDADVEVTWPGDLGGATVSAGSVSISVGNFFSPPVGPESFKIAKIVLTVADDAPLGTYDFDLTVSDWVGPGLSDLFDPQPDAVGVSVNVVPIPSAILLLGGGLISLIAVRRRRS